MLQCTNVVHLIKLNFFKIETNLTLAVSLSLTHPPTHTHPHTHTLAQIPHAVSQTTDLYLSCNKTWSITPRSNLFQSRRVVVVRHNDATSSSEPTLATFLTDYRLPSPPMNADVNIPQRNNKLFKARLLN